MKAAFDKKGLISVLLILIATVVTVTATPLPSAPVVTKDDVKEISGNVYISWKEGTSYFKDPSTGMQIDSFDNLVNRTILTHGSKAIDTAHYQEGSGSLALTFTGTGTNIVKYGVENLNLLEGDGFSMWVYVEDTKKDPFKLALKFISKNDSLSNYDTGKCTICLTARIGSYKYLVNGWNKLSFAKSDFVANGTATWGDTFKLVQITIDPDNHTQTNLTTVYLDDLRFNVQGKPVVMINFDDGLTSTFQTARPILNANGQKATVFVITDYVNTKNGYMWIWDLNTIKEGGWDVSSHTANHDHLLTMNESQMTDSLTRSNNWLKDNGFTPNFLSYPFNEFNDTVVRIAKETGYVMARTTVNGTFEDSPSLKNDESLLRLKSIEVTRNTTIDDLKALVEHTKSTNSTIQILFHEINSAPANDYQVSTAVFQNFSNYLKSTNVAVVTYSDYWNTISSIKPDRYIVEINGKKQPETTDLSATVSYQDCAVTKLYSKNTTYNTMSAPISIAPYCPNAVLVEGIENGGYYNKSVTINLTSPFGTAIKYNLKNETKIIDPDETYTDPIMVEDEGKYTLEVSGLTYYFVIDKTKPTTTVIGVAEGQTYYTPAGVTINFNSTDSISGVMTTVYHLDEEEGNYAYDETGIVRTLVGNHILTYKTYDKAMNIVEGTVNFTISNPPSGGGGGSSSSSSSGGGGGGVSMGSGEDIKNIANFESRDGFLKAGIDTTLLFTTLNQGIYQIFLNGESQELGVRVENLRGKQNGTTDAPDNVLLYTNVLVSSARIKDLSFTFKIDKNNITKLENVKAFVWNNGTWNQLDTKIVSAGGNNAYFQSASTPAKLIKLAISEIKAPDSASQSTMYSSPIQAQKPGPDADTTAIVPSNERPKAPGFGIFAAILALAILYVRLKR